MASAILGICDKCLKEILGLPDGINSRYRHEGGTKMKQLATLKETDGLFIIVSDRSEDLS